MNRKKVLLVLSFGTSAAENRILTIGAIEEELAESFPDYEVRRAFTSSRIIDTVQKREGILIDHTETALKRAVSDCISHLVVQPTHFMKGYEYAKLEKTVREYKDRFESVVLSDPLIRDESDYKSLIEAMRSRLSQYEDERTAICLMGHGTGARANHVYDGIRQKFVQLGFSQYYVGTVEAKPSLNDVLRAVHEGEYERVVLCPMMIVAGDHAFNDMAGDEDDSWKSVFQKAGYDVVCVMEGLGQIPEIRRLFIARCEEALEKRV